MKKFDLLELFLATFPFSIIISVFCIVVGIYDVQKSIYERFAAIAFGVLLLIFLIIICIKIIKGHK